MQGKSGLAKHALIGAGAGIVAAWAMDEFQKLWLKASPGGLSVSGRGHHQRNPRTDVEVMQVIAARTSRVLAGRELTKAQRNSAALMLHYGFGATTGALYGALASKSERFAFGFGSAFGTAFFAIGYAFAPEDLKPSVPPHDEHIVSVVYECLTHVVYGVTLEAGRRGAEAMTMKATPRKGKPHAA